MSSPFDILANQAHASLESVFGQPVSIDEFSGVAIVTPQDDMMLGGGVEMIGGAHLMFRAADFPSVAVRDGVTVGEASYTIIELDDVDSAGIRHARMAPA